MTQENWIAVQMLGKKFFISSLGKVRNSQWVDVERESTKGYKVLQISNHRVYKVASVHRTIARAFIPNPENKPQVNHKNGIKTDNRVENLEWCTAAENMLHAFQSGLIKAPSRRGKPTL